MLTQNIANAFSDFLITFFIIQYFRFLIKFCDGTRHIQHGGVGYCLNNSISALSKKAFIFALLTALHFSKLL